MREAMQSFRSKPEQTISHHDLRYEGTETASRDCLGNK
jgi:hypothetical protein